MPPEVISILKEGRITPIYRRQFPYCRRFCRRRTREFGRFPWLAFFGRLAFRFITEYSAGTSTHPIGTGVAVGRM